MIPNVLFIIRIPPDMTDLPITKYDNGFKYIQWLQHTVIAIMFQYLRIKLINRNVSIVIIEQIETVFNRNIIFLFRQNNALISS
ncbi:hypothetical protein B4V02_23460 [Paenibacillus kribbensis]|uniref:Uncharacterized protein n=1 Tax=Paenibacillus kribbensis TaxID=172713 RepID=A0A222WTD7_9BACL|nr:hypothetical protein B4V02_23460 [Paenibacillus kribbensis]